MVEEWMWKRLAVFLLPVQIHNRNGAGSGPTEEETSCSGCRTLPVSSGAISFPGECTVLRASLHIRTGMALAYRCTTHLVHRITMLQGLLSHLSGTCTIACLLMLSYRRDVELKKLQTALDRNRATKPTDKSGEELASPAGEQEVLGLHRRM